MEEETAICVGCGDEVPIEEGEEMASAVCYRPLCGSCRDET